MYDDTPALCVTCWFLVVPAWLLCALISLPALYLQILTPFSMFDPLTFSDVKDSICVIIQLNLAVSWCWSVMAVFQVSVCPPLLSRKDNSGSLSSCGCYFQILSIWHQLMMLMMPFLKGSGPQHHLSFTCQHVKSFLSLMYVMSYHVIIRNCLSLSMGSRGVAAGANPSLVSGQGRVLPG